MDQHVPGAKPTSGLGKLTAKGSTEETAFTQPTSPPSTDNDAILVKPAAAAPISEGSCLGDFKLVQKLGEGGMGAVYKATQLSLDRDVAIKVLARHLASNQDFVARFQREARIMAKIDHPNVLRCYAF